MKLDTDIYFLDEYISLYLKKGEEIFKFKYEDKGNFFINKSVKRPIIKIGTINMDDGFYDLETAYGYGGFYTNSDDDKFHLEAIKAYDYQCKKENIIAEFIRFNPFNHFPICNEEYFDLNLYDRDTVVIDLNQDYEDVKKSYSSSLIRNINKANRNGLVLNRELINEKSIGIFFSLYTETMKKNNASDFYFFSKQYFKKLLGIAGVKLYSCAYKNKIISMVITFEGSDVVYYHLGATDSNYYDLNPNPFVFDSLVKQMVNKKRYFYLGGGTSSNEEDSLLKFKQKFSKLTKPFYISGKVFNQKIYDQYIDIWKSQSKKNVEYFLKYRLEV